MKRAVNLERKLLGLLLQARFQGDRLRAMGGILSRSQGMRQEAELFQRFLNNQDLVMERLLHELGAIGGPGCVQLNPLGCHSNCHQADCGTLLRITAGLQELQCMQNNFQNLVSRDADTIYKLATLFWTPTVREQASSAVRVEEITAELQLCESRNTFLQSQLQELQQRYGDITRMLTEGEKNLKDAKTHLENEKQLRVAGDQKQKEMLRRIDHLTAANSALEAKCGSLRVDVETLQGQIGQLETQANRQGSACGSYLDSGVTPNDLQLLADKIKQALASFTKVFTTGNSGSLEVEVAGTLGRKSDVKFFYQSMVADTVFRGFEAEDFQIPQCLPTELECEKRRCKNNRQYKEITSLMQGNDPETITDLACLMDDVRWRKMDSSRIPAIFKCLPGCYEGAGPGCVCGRVRFWYFCCNKVEALMLSSLGADYWGQPAQNHRLLDTKLCEQLLPLLTSVWLSHLLANSFEPPGVLLKMGAGMEFDAAYMEKVVVGDEELDIDGRVPRIAFMLMPGFRLGKSVIRGHVYLQALRPINEEQMTN